MHVQVLATEVELEEEYLVNNLQKRMTKLHLEKTDLEKTLEQQRRKVWRAWQPRACNGEAHSWAHARSLRICPVPRLGARAERLRCRGRRWRSSGWSRSR